MDKTLTAAEESGLSVKEAGKSAYLVGSFLLIFQPKKKNKFYGLKLDKSDTPITVPVTANQKSPGLGEDLPARYNPKRSF